MQQKVKHLSCLEDFWKLLAHRICKHVYVLQLWEDSLVRCYRDQRECLHEFHPVWMGCVLSHMHWENQLLYPADHMGTISTWELTVSGRRKKFDGCIALFGNEKEITSVRLLKTGYHGHHMHLFWIVSSLSHSEPPQPKSSLTLTASNKCHIALLNYMPIIQSFQTPALPLPHTLDHQSQ